MPSQQQKRKKSSSKPGSSQTTAIALDSDDDSSSGSELGAPAAATSRGNMKAATTSSTRASLRNRTKASAPVKQAPKASVSAASNKRTHEEITSDSEDYSSDAIFVATSRATATATDKGKGKQRETTSNTTTGKGASSSVKVGNWIAAQKSTGSKKQGNSSIMQVDGETDSSVERLPTPESLVTEESEPAGPSRRLVKSDRTPLKKAPADDEHASSSNAVKGPGFLERLESNSRPQFSKTFKGKVRSSNSTSIPLDDDRFRSDEDDEDYESEDRPSPRKKVVKKNVSPAKPKNSSPRKTASSSQAIDIDDSDSDSTQLQSKRPASQHTTIDSSSDEDLPNLPGPSRISAPSGSSAKKSSQFKENLEELNKRRRLSDKKSKSKSKHAKRVVATPSPSPEPVRVVASRPAPTSPLATTSSARVKQRINIRAISSKGKSPKKKMPMFRAPSDDSDLATENGAANASESDEEVVPVSKKRKGGKGKKVLKRKATPSSSSSSSSSSESSVPDDDEMSEVEEDIALDFDPVVKDKLRPKDNSKAHRLDKLKQARAAKEMREDKRRRGIIDSDDDEKVKIAKAAREEEEGEDDETDSSSAGGVDNFIVEDDGDIDPEELDRAQRMMPTQFSKHGALPLKDHFRIFIASVVFRHFLPKSKHYREKAEFTFSQLQVQNAIDGLINGSIASSIWNADFREALDQRPELAMHKIALTGGCDGCSKMDRTASEEAIVSGKPYDHDTLLDDDDEKEDPPQTFDLGRFCAEKAYFHHSLKHFLKHAADAIRAECRRSSTLGSKLMGDKDDRKEQREKEASRLVNIVSSGNFPLQQRLWGELDQLMERAKHKYLK